MAPLVPPGQDEDVLETLVDEEQVKEMEDNNEEIKIAPVPPYNDPRDDDFVHSENLAPRSNIEIEHDGDFSTTTNVDTIIANKELERPPRKTTKHERKLGDQHYTVKPTFAPVKHHHDVKKLEVDALNTTTSNNDRVDTIKEELKIGAKETGLDKDSEWIPVPKIEVKEVKPTDQFNLRPYNDPKPEDIRVALLNGTA